MFQNDNRYITRGIKEISKKNPLIYLMLWQLIDEMNISESEKDYLQVFTLSAKFGKRRFQEVEHSQEEPPYKCIHRFYTEMPVNAKIFVIDSGGEGGNSTMMLAEEY